MNVLEVVFCRAEDAQKQIYAGVSWKGKFKKALSGLDYFMVFVQIVRVTEVASERLGSTRSVWQSFLDMMMNLITGVHSGA